MGSFNVVCFASNQSIAEGDKTRIQVVLQQSAFSEAQATFAGEKTAVRGMSNSTSYPDSFWRPVSMFIPAVYDGEGGFSLTLETPAQRTCVVRLLSRLMESCATVEPGENSSHDIAVNVKDFFAKSTPALFTALTSPAALIGRFGAPQSLAGEIQLAWDYVAKAVSKGRLFGCAYSRALRPLAIAVVHELSYLGLISTLEATETLAGEPNTFEALAIRALDSTRELVKVLPAVSARALSSQIRFADNLAEALNRAEGSSPFGRTDLHEAIWPMAKSLSEGNDNVSAYLAAILPLMQDRFAYAGLERLALRITPMVGGGQDYSNEIGQAYAAFVSAVSERVTKNRA